MENGLELLDHLDQIHTTAMGVDRIRKNLNLSSSTDVVEYCKTQIRDAKCYIYRQGKNWYCEIDSVRITVNAHSYTIITAHTFQ